MEGARARGKRAQTAQQNGSHVFFLVAFIFLSADEALYFMPIHFVQ
jgi:hypothetical protein